MLDNANLKNSEQFKQLEDVLEELSVALLTKQKIKEEKVLELNDQLVGLAELFQDESSIPKNFALRLFKFYVMAHTEVSFRNPKEKSERLLIAYLQTNITKIFSEK